MSTGSMVDPMAPDTVQNTFANYRTALVQSQQADISTLRGLAEQFYGISLQSFPLSGQIQAAFGLAELDEQEDDYKLAAARVYHWIITTANSSRIPELGWQTAFVADGTAKKRLLALYEILSRVSALPPNVVRDAIPLFAEVCPLQLHLHVRM